MTISVAVFSTTLLLCSYSIPVKRKIFKSSHTSTLSNIARPNHRNSPVKS